MAAGARLNVTHKSFILLRIKEMERRRPEMDLFHLWSYSKVYFGCPSLGSDLSDEGPVYMGGYLIFKPKFITYRRFYNAKRLKLINWQVYLGYSEEGSAKFFWRRERSTKQQAKKGERRAFIIKMIVNRNSSFYLQSKRILFSFLNKWH